MTPENFVYYLQGFLELTEVPGAPTTPPTAAQWALIRQALATVFEKVTPPMEASASPEPARPPEAPPQSAVEAIQRFQDELASVRRVAQRAARDSSGNRRIC